MRLLPYQHDAAREFLVAERARHLESRQTGAHDGDGRRGHSDLPRREIDDESVELRRHLDLAAKPALGQAVADGIVEHGVLSFGYGWHPRPPFGGDIHVARSALTAAAAFRNDTGN